MPGPSGALGSSHLWHDPGREALRIELAWGEDDVDALGLRDLEVARLVAWVRGEVGPLVELRRIDIERHGDAVVLRACRTEESAVAVVERSHCRHKHPAF